MIKIKEVFVSFGTKPCTCQGSNPNCYHCDGTGLIEQAGERTTNSSPSSYKTLHHMCQCSTCVPVQPSSSNKKLRNYTILVKPPPTHPCTTCNRKFKTHQSLNQHMLQKHGVLSIPTPPASPTRHEASLTIKNDATATHIAPTVEKVEIDWENYCTEPDDPWKDYYPQDPYPRPRFICSHCGVKLISAARLEKHTLKVHPIDDASSKKILPISKPPKRTGFIQSKPPAQHENIAASNKVGCPCHLCSAVMKNKQRLLAHINRVHGSIPASKKSKKLQRSTSKKLSGTNSSKRTNALEKNTFSRSTGNSEIRSVYERPEKMDATRGWGGSFRDHGQFGSYPVHDSMDDESFS